MSRSSRYAGRHRQPGRHRAPAAVRARSRAIPHRASAVTVGAVGVVFSVVALSSAPVTAGALDEPATRVSPDADMADSLLAALSQREVSSDVSRGVSRQSLDIAVPTGKVSVTPPATPTPAPPPPATAEKPPTAPAPQAQAPAAAGVNVSAYAAAGAARGLGANARGVYSAIRAQFGITNIGGYRPGGDDHGSGRACDVMITSQAQGDAVAAYAIAHAAELKITYVIWRQRIYLIGQGGWRAMADRGSITANHYDHVHISVR